MSRDKRLALLEQMTASGQADSFAWYGLANEYKSAARIDDALRTFETLRSNDPDYVPMYLICGQMLVEAGRADDGRAWLEAGLKVASERGNSHALSELQDALASLEA